MSRSAVPIPLGRFAEAIVDLPLGNLYAKAAELRNSIAHLNSSNEQLEQYANDGDQDCANAITENQGVLQRMREQINLLKREFESRGFPWTEVESENSNGDIASGRDHEMIQVDGGFQRMEDVDLSQAGSRRTDGTVADEESARRLRERMTNISETDGEGVHL